MCERECECGKVRGRPTSVRTENHGRAPFGIDAVELVRPPVPVVVTLVVEVDFENVCVMVTLSEKICMDGRFDL